MPTTKCFRRTSSSGVSAAPPRVRLGDGFAQSIVLRRALLRLPSLDRTASGVQRRHLGELFAKHLGELLGALRLELLQGAVHNRVDAHHGQQSLPQERVEVNRPTLLPVHAPPRDGCRRRHRQRRWRLHRRRRSRRPYSTTHRLDTQRRHSPPPSPPLSGRRRARSDAGSSGDADAAVAAASRCGDPTPPSLTASSFAAAAAAARDASRSGDAVAAASLRSTHSLYPSIL